MALTWGELKAKFANEPDDKPVFIEIVVEGGTTTVQVKGFTAADTVLRKPVERAENGVVL